MANTLRFKRGLVSGIPTALAGEPLFTTDTFDLYIGNGTTNTRFQKYIASGATTQILRGDGSLYSFPLNISSPSTNQILRFDGTNWINSNEGAGTGTVTSVAMTVPTGLSISGSPITTSGTLALTFAAGYSIPTTAKQTEWDTAYTNRITSLTTTGSSGAATLITNTLNIPNYTLSGLGGVPTSRTLTINGTSFDLSANRSWSVGTVTSVGLSSATSGVTIGSTPITTSGTITIAIATATSGTNGLLSSTDWTTFNNKQPQLNGTGFVKATGTTITYDNSTYLTTSSASSTYLPLAGGTMTGFITLHANPTQALHAVTKQYVDAIAEGLHVHASCEAATPNTLASITGGTVTYNNGTSGVGATLTLSVALNTLDGVTLVNGNRILVKNEANTSHNGIYVRTSSTVLTRATDSDTAIELAGGDFVFVTGGTLYDNTGWVQVEPCNTVGTDPIVYNQFSGAGTYLAGTGLTLTGNTFSANIGTDIQGLITLTTTGSSGAATLVTNTLNIPNYTLTGLGGVPTSRTITINGTAFDLSADRSFSVGTVTSVGLSSSTSGVTIGSTPVTTSGTITLTIATASGSQQGLLSSTDWTTFNNKYTLPSLTSGSVLFSNGTTIAQDNANFFWDNTNKRLGIGTASPSGKLDISNAGDSYVNILSTTLGTSSVLSMYNSNGTTDGAAIGYNVAIRFGTITGSNASGFTERARITSGGNLGLGVTPSAWGSSYKAIQISSRVSLAGDSSQTVLANNWFTNTSGTSTYIETAHATAYSQTSGEHRWFNAPSGAANTAITFTQAMTLSVDGNLGIGNIIPGTDGGVIPRLAVANPSNVDKFVGIGYDNTGDYGFIHAIHRGTAWKKIAIQAFGGNVLIGTTTDSGEKLQVNGTARFDGRIKIGAAYIADDTVAGNDIGIAFSSQGILSTNGSGSFATKNIGTSANPWGAAYLSSRSFINGAAGYLFDVQENGSNKARLQTYVESNVVSLIAGYDTTAVPFSIYTGGSERLIIATTGSLTLSSLAGTGTRMVVADASGVLSTQAIPGGGTGSPGGSNGQVQFNSSGAFGGDANLFWDDTNKRLGVGTNNPQRKLTVFSSTQDDHILISGTGPSVSMTDTITGATYQTKFGLATASNQFATGSVAGDFVISNQTGAIIWALNSVQKMQLKTTSQLQLHAYTSTSSFTGTAAGVLAFDSSGNIITIATPSGGSGTVTSVALASGTSGTDVNITGSPITSSGTITLNIPDAGASARGLMTTGTQTIAGQKTFSGGIVETRINPRSITNTSTSTLTPNVSTDDFFTLTAQAATLTLANPTGTPVDGQKIIVRIFGTSAQTINYGTEYRGSSDLALPTTTTANRTIYLGFIYNSANTKWDLIAELDNFA